MVEKESSRNANAKNIQLPFKETMLDVAHTISPLELERAQKISLCLTISLGLYPKYTKEILTNLGVSESEIVNIVGSVLINPILKTHYDKAVAKIEKRNKFRESLAYSAPTYEIAPFRKSAAGQTKKMFLQLLSEHIEKYQDIPVNTQTIGKTLGVSRQRVWQLLNECQKQGAIPEGLKIKRNKQK